MKTFLVCLTLFFKLSLCWSFLPVSLWSAELPHQGRVVVSGQPFEGKGSFWFALVNEQDELVWNHLGGVGVPDTHIELQVEDGFYQIRLGDTSVSGMAVLPNDLLLLHPKLSLRIWFNDGVNGVHQLGSDQPLPVAASAVVSDYMRNGEQVNEMLGRLAFLEGENNQSVSLRIDALDFRIEEVNATGLNERIERMQEHDQRIADRIESMEENRSSADFSPLATAKITALEEQLEKAFNRIETLEASKSSGGVSPMILAQLGYRELPDANLTGVNLSSVILRKAQYQGTDLQGANLRETDFSDANLSRSNLSSANLNQAILRNAELMHTDLTGANLREAVFAGANLHGSDLSSANLEKADFTNTSLAIADLGDANLHMADFTSADLNGSNLSGANLDGALFHNASLASVTLTDANLTKANFREANLTGADLSGAILKEADLSIAKLQGSDLSRAELNLADFTDANLSEAGFTGSTFGEANLFRADLSSTDLRGHDLTRAILSSTSFRQADLRGVQWPSGLSLYAPNFMGAKLSDPQNPIDLNGSKLDGNFTSFDFSKFSLRNTEFRGIFQDANFSHAQLQGSSVPNGDGAANRMIDFSHSDFSDANLSGSVFYRTHSVRMQTGVTPGDAYLQIYPTPIYGNVGFYVKADFSDGDFRNSDFSNAILTGVLFDSSNLSGSDLSGSDLSDVDFSGSNLTGVNFTDAILNHADLNNTTIDKVTLESLGHANSLKGLDLSDFDLSGLDFSGVDLSGTSFAGSDLSGVDFRNSNLNGTDLNGSILDRSVLESLAEATALQNIDLSGQDLSGLDFSGYDLGSSDLSDSDLTDSNFSNAKLGSAQLLGADLKGVDFSNADLTNLNLSGGNLTGADFTGANLANVDLNGSVIDPFAMDTILQASSLVGVNFAGQDLRTITDPLILDFNGSTWNGVNFSGVDWSTVKNDNDPQYNQDLLTMLRGTASSMNARTEAVYSFPFSTSRDFPGYHSFNVIDFTNVDLSSSNLANLDMTGIILDGADLQDANLSGVNLNSLRVEYKPSVGGSYTTVSHSPSLVGANLQGADLSNTYLVANMTGANLSGANLSGATFSGVDLTDANLTDAILPFMDGVTFSNTILPDGFVYSGESWYNARTETPSYLLYDEKFSENSGNEYLDENGDATSGSWDWVAMFMNDNYLYWTSLFKSSAPTGPAGFFAVNPYEWSGGSYFINSDVEGTDLASLSYDGTENLTIDSLPIVADKFTASFASEGYGYLDPVNPAPGYDYTASKVRTIEIWLTIRHGVIKFKDESTFTDSIQIDGPETSSTYFEIKGLE